MKATESMLSDSRLPGERMATGPEGAAASEERSRRGARRRKGVGGRASRERNVVDRTSAGKRSPGG